LRRRNDSFRVTDVMDRSLRVLAGRLSTDARVWTGVHGRFGRRLAAEPVVRTETSSSILIFSSRRRRGGGAFALRSYSRSSVSYYGPMPVAA
jgi:hypothetical protein